MGTGQGVMNDKLHMTVNTSKSMLNMLRPECASDLLYVLLTDGNLGHSFSSSAPP